MPSASDLRVRQGNAARVGKPIKTHGPLACHRRGLHLWRPWLGAVGPQLALELASDGHIRRWCTGEFCQGGFGTEGRRPYAPRVGPSVRSTVARNPRRCNTGKTWVEKFLYPSSKVRTTVGSWRPLGPAMPSNASRKEITENPFRFRYSICRRNAENEIETSESP